MKIGYLRSGIQVEIIEETDSGYIVDPFIEVRVAIDDIEFQPSGYPVFEKEVFDNPPKNIYHKSIEDAQARLDDIRQQANEAHDKLMSAKAEQKELAKEFKNIPVLKNIQDFIKGDFEYFACPEKYTPPYIEEKDKFLKQDDRYDNGKTRLLSLFGKSNGNLEWKVNQYSDGSGNSSFLAIPCKTKQEAVDIVSENFTTYITNIDKEGRKFYGVYEKVKWLIDNGFEVDSEWLHKAVVYERERLESDVNSNKKYVNDYQKRVDSSQKKLDDFNGSN